jgi:hypothetical protein
MGRLDGVREVRHQPFYDTLVRGIGISQIDNLRQLFGNANVGQSALTNLKVPGQFASDQTYIVKVLRVLMWFRALDANFAAYGDLPALNGNTTATNTRMLDLYSLMAYGAYFQAVTGDKPIFTAPLWYAPQGGGPSGFTTENSQSIVTNGEASTQAVLKLGMEIHVPARQNIGVTIEFFPFPRLGNGQNGAIPANLSPLDYLNQYDGCKLIQFYLDGIQTRDVQ